jgi:uncharacterized protein (TIGR00369 family)
MTMRVKADTYCFGCGPDNPVGLRLSGFRMVEGERYEVDFTPLPEHQGWQEIVHGGIIATVVDEVMTRLLWELGMEVVTAELTVRYKRPLQVGTAVRATAWKERDLGRYVEVAASVSDGEQEYATATGRFVRLDVGRDKKQ